MILKHMKNTLVKEKCLTNFIFEDEKLKPIFMKI